MLKAIVSNLGNEITIAEPECQGVNVCADVVTGESHFNKAVISLVNLWWSCLDILGVFVNVIDYTWLPMGNEVVNIQINYGVKLEYKDLTGQKREQNESMFLSEYIFIAGFDENTMNLWFFPNPIVTYQLLTEEELRLYISFDFPLFPLEKRFVRLKKC